MGEDFLHAAYVKGAAEWQAMEGLTKGLKFALPAGHSFADKDGHTRHNVRIRWWEAEAHTYRDLALMPSEDRARPSRHPAGKRLTLTL